MCSDVPVPSPAMNTRRSLISRLRNLDDRESWQDFFDTYWKLIFSVARKAGLSEQEAEEVVQETTFATVSHARLDQSVTRTVRVRIPSP